MEALLSARDHLMVSWSSRDGRKGEAMPPATPVRQWLEWLQGALPCGGAALVVEHPANPLDRANFEPIGERPPGSCDRRLLEARQWIETAQLRKPLPLASRGPATQTQSQAQTAAAPEAPEDPYTDLRDWLANPQTQWLAQLGLKPQEWAELLRDLDSLSLDERQRSQLLRQALDGADGENASATGDPASWLKLHRGQGLLPPLAAGNLEAITLAQRWQSLHASLAALGEPKHLVVRWGPWQCELEQRGSSVVLLHTAQARSRHHMELWLQLLVASASGLNTSQGVLVARGEKGFGTVLQVNSPSAEAAQAEIERLAQLRQTWRDQCWPLPPQTGWAYAEAEQRKPGSGLAKAIACWEGGIARRGERDDAEHSLCFGSALAGPELLTPQALALAAELYAPLLEQQR
jgi:exodeoxyribonuclease V gamma subunit